MFIKIIKKKCWALKRIIVDTTHLIVVERFYLKKCQDKFRFKFTLKSNP